MPPAEIANYGMIHPQPVGVLTARAGEVEERVWFPTDPAYVETAQRVAGEIDLAHCNADDACLSDPPQVVVGGRGVSGQAFVDNAAFRAIRSATPGPYTFILPAMPEVPRRLMHPKKRTVGVRIPDHTLVCALLEELGEPILTSTLILPGETEARTMGWEIKEDLDHAVDIVVESGEVTAEPTSVIDWSEAPPVVVRRGAGDVSRFED